MEGPISFWGYKEQESNLILPERDDDDDDEDDDDDDFRNTSNEFLRSECQQVCSVQSRKHSHPL